MSGSSGGYRLQRVQNLLKEVTSEIIRRIKDPRVGFVSVTDVEVSPDLRHAKVFVSVLGDKTERKDTLEALQNASGFVRHELSQSVQLRHIPALHFHLDESLEHGQHIISLLNQVKAKEEGEPPAEV
ncbi:MAG: 30S ribosome-binding factor RbfA [Candidatus Xenobia bacterium]